MKKLVRENLFEAKLNLPQEYINKVTQEAKQQYGHGPTRQDIMEMSGLQNQITRIQRGHEEELTELGKKIIQKFYGPVIQGVELDIKIVNPDDEEKLEMAQKMLGDEEQQEQQQEQEIELELPGLESDIDKRKFINNIMQGEAQNVHDMMYDAIDEVKKITGNEQLLDLYMRFLALNKKFDWDDRVNLEQMMQQAPEMANAMETDWEEGEDGDKPKIKARVLDLPMLVHETVKGIYELIASGAIDPDPVRAQRILKATDTLTDEQQDIRFGPYIARDLRNYVNAVADKITGAYDIPNMREFVFGKMIQLRSEEFVKLVTSILMNEKGPETIISKYIKEIQDDFKQHAASQIPGFSSSEEEQDENLPDDIEDYEDNELKNLVNKQKEEPYKQEQPQQKKKKYVEMGLAELNFQLNKAIDTEDWIAAKEIQEVIERKGGIKESLNEYNSIKDKKFAVAFNIKLNWGGDVMFNESDFKVDTLDNFFNNKNFMEKIHNAINELSKIHSDDETFDQFINGISNEEELNKFFNWVDSNEIYSEGIIDAMDYQTYMNYLNDQDYQEYEED